MIINKLFVALVLLMGPSIAWSQNQGLGYGMKVSQTDPGFLIRDFSAFSLVDKDAFGFERYGFGSGQLELTNRPQIKATNRSGVLLGKGIYRMGLELGNGFISYQNRPDYEWSPSLSFGLKLELEKAAGIYVGPRLGLSYQKGKNEPIAGAIISTQLVFINANYYIDNYQNSNDRLEVLSLSVGDKFNFEKQNSTALKDVYMFVVRQAL